MPTELPERRTAPDKGTAFLLPTLAMLLLAAFLSVAALSWLGLSFGPDGDIEPASGAVQALFSP